MQKPFIPDGYQLSVPFLMLHNATAFFSFMEKVFGATEKLRHLREDGSMLHGELQIGDCTFMYSDASEEWGEQAGGFYIHVVDTDATYATAIQEGCTSIMQPGDQPYGRSCGVKDPFGNTWWITTTQPGTAA